MQIKQGSQLSECLLLAKSRYDVFSMIWEEFQIQAKQDFASCKVLRKENDFGNSAYLLQQSLEKYLKAYLFKYEIFSGEPKNLGHLPLRTLWKEFENDVERGIRHASNTNTKLMFEKFLPVIKEVLKLFDELKNSKNTTLKHAFWKESLNHPLNEEEKRLAASIRQNLERLLPSIMDTSELISTNTEKIKENLSNPETKMKIIEQIQKSTGFKAESIIDVLSLISANTKSIQTISDMQKLPPQNSLSFLTQMIQNVHTPENESQARIKKLFQGTWPFQFISEIMQVFTHEDIGRYPIEIDGKISRVIYVEHADDLDNLIEKIETVCTKIAQRL